MRRFPILSALTLLLAGCLGGAGAASGGNLAGVDWDADLVGDALDLDGAVVGRTETPARISLRPVGEGNFAVFLTGRLDFRLFDPVFNLALGNWSFDLAAFDGRRGHEWRNTPSNRFGVFTFEGAADFFDPALGTARVDFRFWLAPQESFLLAADTALLDWEAELHAAGSAQPYVPPAEARLRGRTTLAVRAGS
ncbi:MAG: hypothetical protein D6702_07960 [Planctomycetota bacterium]|nr:MAG: hypothetical protein D6702_07960 [Planctomycetota bacterium]